MSDNENSEATATQQETPASTTEESATPQRQFLKVSDDLIFMIRELFQYCILTGTNVVDSLRGLVCEVSQEDGRFVTVAPEFIEAYNKTIEDLNKKAEEQMSAMQSQLATEDDDDNGTPPASGGSVN